MISQNQPIISFVNILKSQLYLNQNIVTGKKNIGNVSILKSLHHLNCFLTKTKRKLKMEFEKDASPSLVTDHIFQSGSQESNARWVKGKTKPCVPHRCKPIVGSKTRAVKILTPNTSVCGLIWKQDLCKCKVIMRLLGWALIPYD